MAKTKEEPVDITSLSADNKRRVKAVIEESAEAMGRIDNEKSFIKEGIDDICTELNLDKKIVKKMATTYYKDSFKDDVEYFEQFEATYDLILSEATK